MVSAMTARKLIALAVIIALIPSAAFGSVIHQCNVTTDEHVRYQQCAERARIAQEREQAETYAPQWYESDVTWDYTPSYDTFDASDGISASEFMYYGVVEDGERFYTWYSERVLPGGGLTELNENGRHSEGGFVKDGDGYIAVASCDYPKGTVIETPWGQAKVYDTGYLQPGQVDVYTSF